MKKEFLIEEQENIKQNILIFIKRLKYLLLNMKYQNSSDKKLYADLLNETA